MGFNKRKLKMIILIFFLTLILAVIFSIILKYNTEGETNMPFAISKIIVISTAEGIDKESEYKWDLDIVQVNDIYIEIDKNKNYSSTEIIDKIIIDNIKIKNKLNNQEINLYKTSEERKDVYNDKENYLINNSVEYIGAEKTDNENLTIANQGGLVTLKCVNENLGKYQSNNDEEIRHDGTILKKIGINNIEEIKNKLNFDISILLKSGIKYKGNIEIELPVGDIIKEGVSYTENTELKNVIFKRQ